MLPTRIGALYRMAEFSSLNNWTSERWKIGQMERCLVGLDATSELFNTYVVSSNGLVIYLPCLTLKPQFAGRIIYPIPFPLLHFLFDVAEMQHVLLLRPRAFPLVHQTPWNICRGQLLRAHLVI